MDLPSSVMNCRRAPGEGPVPRVVPELAGSGAREPPAQPAGLAPPELEVSLGEGALLRGLPGSLLRLWPAGGHQFGQTGSGGPHGGGQRGIAIRAFGPELCLAN